jgi:hypothetical protein
MLAALVIALGPEWALFHIVRVCSRPTVVPSARS